MRTQLKRAVGRSRPDKHRVVIFIAVLQEGRWPAPAARSPGRLSAPTFRPTGRLAPLTGDLTWRPTDSDLKGSPAGLPDRHHLWRAEQRALLGSVPLFQREPVWVADTPTPDDRAA